MGAPAAVGDAQRQRPVFGVINALAAAQRVAGFDQGADFIVGVMPFTTLWVGGLEQLPGEHLVLPAMAQRVDMFVDLVQWPPKILIRASEAVHDTGFAFFQALAEPEMRATTDLSVTESFHGHRQNFLQMRSSPLDSAALNGGSCAEPLS